MAGLALCSVSAVASDPTMSVWRDEQSGQFITVKRTPVSDSEAMIRWNAEAFCYGLVRRGEYEPDRIRIGSLGGIPSLVVEGRFYSSAGDVPSLALIAFTQEETIAIYAGGAPLPTEEEIVFRGEIEGEPHKAATSVLEQLTSELSGHVDSMKEFSKRARKQK